MSIKVLITGGSGSVGSCLSKLLKERGDEVVHLSRYRSKSSSYQTFTWDISKEIIEEGAFDGVNHIVHLAGAGVADWLWTSKRKAVLTSSRVDSANLIHKSLKDSNQKIESFISASAIGIYGFDTGGILQTEDRIQFGDDFLATLIKKWESAANQFDELDARVVKLRIGLVLSKGEGLLGKLVPLANLGLSTAFGSGDQYMSWIHIQDLAQMLLYAIDQQQIKGSYNAVAPNPISNKEFVSVLAKVINRPFFLPNTPKFLMKLALGEMSSIVTGGNRVSSKKIEDAGFTFQFNSLQQSLRDLLC